MPKDCQKCKDKVTALIANKDTNYGDADRTWLENLELEQLEKLEPKVVEKEVPGVVTNEQIMSAFQESVKTPEDFLKFIPEGMRDQFKSGLDLQTNAKNKMVEAIMANAEGVWEKKELEAMPIGSVTKIYKSLINEEDRGDSVNTYVGGGGLEVNTDDEDDIPVLAPMGVTLKTKKD